MTRFLLLRHAAHDLAGRAFAGRLPGLGLNALGTAQARALAEAFAAARGGGKGVPEGGGCNPSTLPLDGIYSSPQPRTLQTAQPIAERLGLSVGLAPEFDEIDFGAWTGQAFEALRVQEPQAWARWCDRRSQATPPGGEPFAQVPLRAAAGLARLAAAHPGQNLLLVSHADVIRAVLAAHLGIPLDELERFEIGCASVSVLDWEPGWSRVRLVNGSF
ncbi:histidine phosphatase family protein [Ramlibacter sp. AN1015]|uniref:histidine phosphatase family protein n=1 Tax=Ramlibacter sp. AN1015 TaxID=3133428 RepID=UPI0030C2A9C1